MSHGHCLIMLNICATRAIWMCLLLNQKCEPSPLLKERDGPSKNWHSRGDRQNLLEMRGKQDMGEWIWNRGINGFLSTCFSLFTICDLVPLCIIIKRDGEVLILVKLLA